MGHAVSVVDDRPGESVAFRSLAKLGYWVVDTQIERHAKNVVSLITEGCYDRVIYVGGMSFCFTVEQFRMIREATEARFTAFLWDSFENCQRFANCLDLFDEVLSFDPVDCERCGLHFRPLFYDERYSLVPLEPDGGFIYDACFVGSVHQVTKYEAVLGICEGLKERGMSVYTHFYMPSRSSEIFRKITRRSYRKSAFTNDSLTVEGVASVYGKSKAVIDSPQSGQCGLTMRTLEVLGSNRKLITTNGDIVNYDFYDPANIFVSIGGSVPPSSFFEEGYRSLPGNVVDSYSIRGFCEALIDLGERNIEYRKASS